MEPTRSSRIDAIVEGLKPNEGFFSSSKRLAYIKGTGFVAMSKSRAGSQEDGKIVSLENLANKVKEYVNTHETEKKEIIDAIDKRKKSLQGRITGISWFFKSWETIHKIEDSIQKLEQLKRKVESNVDEDDFDYDSDDRGSNHSGSSDDAVGAVMQKTMTIPTASLGAESDPATVETPSAAPTGGPPPPPPPPPKKMKSANHTLITEKAGNMRKFAGESSPPTINEDYDLGKVTEIPQRDREEIAMKLEKYANSLEKGIERVIKKLQDHADKKELVKGSREDLDEARKNLGALGVHQEGLGRAKANNKPYVLEKGKNKTPVPVGPEADGKKYILSYEEALKVCSDGIETWEKNLEEREAANEKVKKELKEIEGNSEGTIPFIDLDGLCDEKQAVLTSLRSVVKNLRAKPKAGASPKEVKSPPVATNAAAQLDLPSQAQLKRDKPRFILDALLGK